MEKVPVEQMAMKMVVSRVAQMVVAMVGNSAS